MRNEGDEEANTEAGFNVSCMIDIWHKNKGLCLLNSNCIKVRRESQKERDERLKKMMDVIGQIIEDAQASGF